MTCFQCNGPNHTGACPGKADLVYRVVLSVCHRGPDSPDEWVVEARQVKHRTYASIQLARSFTGMVKVKFALASLGHLFFEDEASAVRDFAVKQRRNVESAERMKQEAEGALKWAEQWARENVLGLVLIEGEAKTS